MVTSEDLPLDTLLKVDPSTSLKAKWIDFSRLAFNTVVTLKSLWWFFIIAYGTVNVDIDLAEQRMLSVIRLKIKILMRFRDSLFGVSL